MRPLLFFSILFLFCWQQLLAQNGELNGWILLAALALVGMGYSKYHAILVAFFVIIPARKNGQWLFFRKDVFGAGFFGCTSHFAPIYIGSMSMIG